MKNNISTAVSQGAKIRLIAEFMQLSIAEREAYVDQLNRKMGITKGRIHIL